MDTAAAIGVPEDTNLTSPSEEQGGKLPRKKGTVVSWPRRDRKGLHIHRGASSHGGSSSGGAGFSVPYGILPPPGFEAPARFVGKYKTRRWREHE